MTKYNEAEFQDIGVRFLLDDGNQASHFVYRPPHSNPPVAQNATIGVKFSNDIFLCESFLKQKNIFYEESDLEDSPFGKGIRVRRTDDRRK